MTEDNEHQNAPEEQPEPVEEKKQRFARLRTIGAGTVIALLVGLLVGGAGGFAVGALTTDGHGPGDRGGFHGRPFDDEGDGGGRGFAPPPGGVPGQTPPSTAPEDSSDLNS